MSFKIENLNSLDRISALNESVKFMCDKMKKSEQSTNIN